jgi:hypothetical protein
MLAAVTMLLSVAETFAHFMSPLLKRSVRSSWKTLPKRLMTDESKLYNGAGEHFASHKTIKHSRNGSIHRSLHEADFVEGRERR